MQWVIIYRFNCSDNTPYEKVGNDEPVSIADEIPFEIPESWVWCRIGSLFNLQAGKNISSTEISTINYPGSYPCFGGNGVRGYVGNYNREGHYPLIGRQGALCGNINFAKGKFYATEHAVVVESFGGTDVNWAGLFLEALNLNQYATATAQPGLAVANINKLLIPLPSAKEQLRIVENYQELLPIINRYGVTESRLRKLNAHFPEKLKKSILQMAVQGKLVPQDPNDEPASVLLERIRTEKERLIKEGKIKRDKNESVIYRRDNSHYEKLDNIEQCVDDEIPFDIPASWEWSRLRSIAELQTGTTPPTGNKDYFGSGFPFIKPGDISPSGIDYCNESLTELGSRKSRLIPQDSVLMVCIGGSIGKCYYTDRAVCCNQQINSASPYAISHKYLWVVLSNDYIYKRIIATAGGTATPIINKSLWGELLIPIPPLNEQARITSLVEALNAFIKML